LVGALVSMALMACGGDDPPATGTPAGAQGSGGSGGSGSGGSSGAGASSGSGGELPGPETITLTTLLDETPENAPFVAAQDGDGPWQALSGNDGVFTFETDGRFGLAYLCEDSIFGTTLHVIHATSADFVEVTRTCHSSTERGMASVHFAFEGLGPADSVDLLAGPYVASGFPASFDLEVPIGTWDIVASRRSGTNVSDRIIVRRDVVLQNGDTALGFDFKAEGEDTVLRQVTIANPDPRENLVGRNLVELEGSPGLPLHAEVGWVATAPAGLLRGNDRNVIELVATTETSTRAVRVSATEPDDQQLTLLDPFKATISPVSAATPLFEFDFAASAGAQAYELGLSQVIGFQTRRIEVTISAAWLASTREAPYVTPHLGAVAGWDAAWDLVDGLDVPWEASLRESTDGVGFDDPGATPAEGAIERGSGVHGVFTPKP
jgi:hypothetical protein